MPAEVEVLHPGLFSTIQDLGRTGYMKFGVPISGSMDLYAAKMANLLLQNVENAAVLEMTQFGPKLKFGENCKISITGGDLSPKLNGRSVAQNAVIIIEAGDVLSFGSRKSGCRAYLGITGGFKTEVVLGSRSWYEGVTENRKLSAGNRLPYESHTARPGERFASLKIDTSYLAREKITVYAGPEFEALSLQQRDWLENQMLSVSKNNDRMAIQLEEKLENGLEAIITGPVLPGTVQLTPSGKMIVLMRDCQTTGGYPRILQVSEQGINVLAQKVLGDAVAFEIEAL